MSFTEVVLEVANGQDPLLDALRRDPTVEGVLRPLRLDRQQGILRSHLTLEAQDGHVPALVHGLRANRRLDVTHLRPVDGGHAVLEVQQPIGGPGGPHPLTAFLDRVGDDVLLDPCLVTGGTLHLRGLVPNSTGAADVVQALQALQRDHRWSTFRVVRVREVTAGGYTSSLRRVLPPSVEALLRLAVDLGYYRSPRACTLEDIAGHVNLTASPVHKRLKSAENLLVASHVDPAGVPYPRVGPDTNLRLEPSSAARGALLDVGLWIRGSDYLPARFSADHPESRVVVHSLRARQAEGRGGALVVVEADEAEQAALRDLLQRMDGTEVHEEPAGDARHALFRCLDGSALLPWIDGDLGLDEILASIGGPVFPDPVVVEAGEVWLRFLAAGDARPADVADRVAAAAARGGWEAHHLVEVRSRHRDPARSSLGDRGTLTGRQDEVLRISHALGYYRTPRACTLEDVARALGISANAVHKNLSGAEERLVTRYVATRG